MFDFIEQHIVYQENAQLHHEMTVTNVSSSDKEIDTLVIVTFLYSVSDKEYVDRNSEPFILYEDYEKFHEEAKITLKPQQSYSIVRSLSAGYSIPVGKKKYQLRYFPNAFDTLDVPFKEREKKEKSITFTWHQNPNTNTGYLVGDVVYPSE